MTAEQKMQIQILREQYTQNCSKYATKGSHHICSFTVQKSSNPEDKSVTVVWNQITGIDDNLIPESELVFYNITEDGNCVNLALILDFKQMADYTGKLIDL